MKPEILGDSWATTRFRISSSWRTVKVMVIFFVAILFTIPPCAPGLRQSRIPHFPYARRQRYPGTLRSALAGRAHKEPIVLIHRNRLFLASCVALITTSMLFSIRGDILDALGADFHLTKQQTGLILSPAFWGFTLSILIGGALVDFFGMRRLMTLSSIGYLV